MGREILFCGGIIAAIQSIIEDERMKAMSSIDMVVIVRGVKVALAPRTRRMLAMLEPMMLPRAISDFPLRSDMSDAASSGRDVAPATRVMAMMFWGMAWWLAIRTALSMNI